MEKAYFSGARIVSSTNIVALALAFSLLISACGGGAGGGAIEAGSLSSSSSSSDTISPVVTITAPTSGTSYTTPSASVAVTGTATDNIGLSQISWSNNLGGSGNILVSGTSASGSFNIALISGANVITVIARDTTGNTAQKQLTVNYTPTTSNMATLAWDAVAATNILGYRLYYGTAPRTYLQPLGQGLSVGNVTTYVLMGLSNRTRYYFAVTSIDALGNESGYSNEAFKDIP
jgi:hypothetical protein